MIMLLRLLLIMMMTAMIMTTNSATACQAKISNSHLMPQTYRFSSAQRLHFCSACSRPF
jgi:hypothetical protein